MARRLINGRFRNIDQPGVVDVSRLLVTGYLVAIVLGALLGVMWMAYRIAASWF
jgi:hypothetical protein